MTYKNQKPKAKKPVVAILSALMAMLILLSGSVSAFAVEDEPASTPVSFVEQTDSGATASPGSTDSAAPGSVAADANSATASSLNNEEENDGAQPELSSTPAVSIDSGEAEVVGLFGAKAGGIVQLNNFRSSNAKGFVTNSSNKTPLALTGQYQFLQDTPEEGVNVTFTLQNNASIKYADGSQWYFEQAAVLDLPSSATLVGSTFDPAAGTLMVVLNLKGKTNGSGNFTINFPFNSNFNGWVPNAASLATISVSGPLETVPADIPVASSTMEDPRFASMYVTPLGNIIPGGSKTINTYFLDQRTNGHDDLYWRMKPGTQARLVMEYPKDAQISGTQINKSTLVGKPGWSDGTTQTWVWDLGTVREDGTLPEGYWTMQSSGARYLGWSQLKLSFPKDKFEVEEKVNLNWYIEYTPYGATNTSKVYAAHAGLSFKFEEPKIHMLPNKMTIDGYSPNVDIDAPAEAGGQTSYRFIQNAGGVPVPNMAFTWYNDTQKPANLTHIFMLNEGAVFKSEVRMTFSDGSDKKIFVPEIGIGSNRRVEIEQEVPEGAYIEKLEIFPLNNPNDSLDNLTSGDAAPVYALPFEAGLIVRVHYRSWDSKKFPVPGTPAIQHGDFSNTKAIISWEGESKPEEHKSPALDNPEGINGVYSVTIKDLPRQKIYYGNNSPFPVVNYENTPGGSLSPGNTFEATVSFFNLVSSAASIWKNPMILLVPPEILDLDTSQKPLVTNREGTSFGTATIQEVMLEGGRRAYTVTPDKKDLELIPTSSTSALTVYLVKLSFTVKNSAAAGTYNLDTKGRTVGSPEKYGYLFGTTTGTGNNLLYRTDASSDRDFFDDRAANWDNNTNTPYLYSNGETIITIAEVQDLSVTAQLLDNEKGEWVNVQQAEANATVPLQSTGKIKLEMANNGTTYVGDLALLNILPRIGDEMVTSAAAKGSEWDAYMENISVKVVDTDGQLDPNFSAASYTMKYDKNNNPGYSGGEGGINRTGSAAFGANATTNKAEAGSFEFKFAGGYRLAPGSTIVIEITVKAPAGADRDQLDKEAYNAYAVSGKHYTAKTGGTAVAVVNAVEPGKQTFKLADKPTAVITSTGLVFKDYNMDGLYTPGVDAPYEGAIVQLYVKDAITGLPAGGDPFKETTTDAGGKYQFTELYAKDYFVKVIKPHGAAYSFVATAESTVANGSHVDAEGYTPVIAVNAGLTTEVVYNAGIQTATKVTVQYTLGGFNHGSAIPLVSGDALGAGGTLSGNVKPGVTAGVALPEGYILAEGEDDEKVYSLGWNTPQLVVKFALQQEMHNLIFNKSYDDAAGSIADVPVQFGKNSSLPSGGFARPGYTLVGWTDDAANKDIKKYDFGYSYKLESHGDVTFYAVWQAKTVDIIYNTNGGSPASGGTTLATYNTTLAEAAATSRAGYTLAGWRAPGKADNWVFGAGGTAVTAANGVAEDEAGTALELAAQWNANTNTGYTIKYYQQNINDDNYTEVAEDAQVKNGTTDTLLVLAEENIKTYTGFESTPARVAFTTSAVELETTVPQAIAGDGSLAVHIYYNRTTHSITYQPGTYGGFATQTTGGLRYGVAVPAFAGDIANCATGYTFKEWIATEGVAGTTITGDVVFTADWSANKHKLHFNANGGINTVASITVAFGIGADLPGAGGFSRKGYTQTGWTTDPEGETVTEYALDGEYTLQMDSDVTLYAKWTANNYSISFNANGGSGTPMQDIEIDFDETVTLPQNTYANEGYTFLGWSIDNASVEEYKDGASYKHETDGIVVLYAVWQAKSYTLSFNAMGGVPAPEPQQVAYKEKAAEPEVPAKEGHSFIGWYSAETGGIKWGFDSKTMPAADTVLYAQYLPIGYTVTFDYAAMPKDAEKVSVDFGTLVPEPAKPTWLGYTFNGWKAEDGAKWNFAQKTMLARDMKLTADWVKKEADTFTVKFADWDGRVISTQTVAPNQNATLPQNPARRGYRFEGWNASHLNITKDMVITALYTMVVPASSSSVSSGSESWPESGTSSPPPASSEPVVPSSPDGGTSAGGGPASSSSVSTTSISGVGVPMGGFSIGGTWGLANLLIAIAGFAMSCYLVVSGLRKRDGRRKMSIPRIISAMFGVITIAVFLIVEDFTNAAVWFDRWTPLIAALFLTGIIFNIIQFIRGRHPEMPDKETA